MKEIPKEIQDKIESKVSDECNPDSQEGMLRKRFAYFGYQLAPDSGEYWKKEKLLLDFCHFLGKKGYKINGYDDGQLSTIIEQFKQEPR